MILYKSENSQNYNHLQSIIVHVTYRSSILSTHDATLEFTSCWMLSTSDASSPLNLHHMPSFAIHLRVYFGLGCLKVSLVRIFQSLGCSQTSFINHLKVHLITSHQVIKLATTPCFSSSSPTLQEFSVLECSNPSFIDHP